MLPSSDPKVLRPRLRSVLTTLAAVLLAVGYDAVALLPLWALRVPRHVAASVQHLEEPLRLALALSSLAAIWWGLYGIHGAGARRAGLADRVLVWSGLAVVLALLIFPALFLGS